MGIMDMAAAAVCDFKFSMVVECRRMAPGRISLGLLLLLLFMMLFQNTSLPGLIQPGPAEDDIPCWDMIVPGNDGGGRRNEAEVFDTTEGAGSEGSTEGVSFPEEDITGPTGSIISEPVNQSF